ncbi:Zinc finger MYM-type protein 1 [Frankliniella fusca]|uniref:Zinc finger MYM-type protein 1 n=1 Tax=Frankliniella fusca TaxID=407009 RepID=A0AAE1HND6_9NEOP|nr:Zinc finger MYM-type protein 1 [Frankliniella fusca]
MGKWAKYAKNYNEKWEKDPKLKQWLTCSSEEDIMNGKGEAYCKVCCVNLRAQHADLLKHAKREKHISKMQSLNRNVQPSLDSFGKRFFLVLVSVAPVVVSNAEKIVEIRLAMFIAMHSSVRSMDHLGELLKELGKGSSLEKLRMHRTKCSRIISQVIAPALLTELVEDVGDEPFSIIADEATDNSTSKFMGLCIRYYSEKKKEMITDFLGLLQVIGTKGIELSDAVKEYFGVIGLKIQNMTYIATDGAANMCGVNNSFFTHLRETVPHLQAIKCICHSIDKCSEYAHKCMPPCVNKILKETHNWFAHSTVRQADYEQYYQTINDGKKPGKIPRMVDTRWLSWLPPCEFIVSQWVEMRAFFGIVVANAKDSKTKASASEVLALYKDQSLYLYLLFLRGILRQVNKVNLAFQHTNADVTKLHTELRELVFSVARRIVKEQAIPATERSSVIRMNEIEALRRAVTTPANLLPLDRAGFGESFRVAVSPSNLSEEELRTVRNTCGQYLYNLCLQLFDRLPSNVESVEKLRHLRPHIALARVARPQFRQLPLDLARPGEDLDTLENQWMLLGSTPLPDLCTHPEMYSKVEEMDVVHFWGCALTCKNAAGEYPFRELARFALRCLTIPISNAVVERIFSFLAAIKTKQRNRLQHLMLEALLRIRAHSKVSGVCCRTFIPSRNMISRFTSQMYACRPKQQEAGQQGEDDGNPDDPDDPDAVQDIDQEDYAALDEMFSNDGPNRCLGLQYL